MKKVLDSRWVKIYKVADKYIFKIYPCNNKNQELGTSIEYVTREECEVASDEFICFVLREIVKDKTSKYIKYEQYKDESNCWHYRYVCDNDKGQPVFYQRYVGQKSNAQKGVNSLYTTLEKAYGGMLK